MKLFRVAILFVATLPLNTLAQFVNNDWKWGREYQDTSSFPWGGTTLIFNTNNVTINEEQNRSLNIKGTYSGLGTADGQYFIYTNGYTICNKNHDTISNGAGLTPGGNDSLYRLWGIPIPSNAILLPYPGSDRLMVMISADNYYENGVYFAKNIFYSLIDPSGNNGQGIVLTKNQILLTDTFTIGGYCATKHANGRDWWIIIKSARFSDFAKILITANGPSFEGFDYNLGPNSAQGGQGSFSPDGKYLAYFSSNIQLRIYDFERCSGSINNLRYKTITNLPSLGGLAFSPNSRYLYISKLDSLWQFDLQAADILASQILIASYTPVPDPVTGWITGFSYLYLAADGKIYIQNYSGVMLHVINSPDLPGQACNFVQNQIQCPTYYYVTVPTYVNLNLMQVHGSICDTLGVGIEELSIKNEQLKIAPNPSNGNINIEFPVQEISGLLYVYDINGKQVYSEYVSPYTYIKNINLQGKLSSGMYALSMVFGEERYLGKVVVE
jgi:hypothetical protein